MSTGSGSISAAEIGKSTEPDAAYGYTFAQEGGEEWLYAYSDSSRFHTRLLYKIPLASITGKQVWFQKLLVLISFVFLAFVLMFVLYLVRLVVKPVVKLVSVMKIYEPGIKLPLSEEPLRHDEFGILQGSFVKMTRRLDHSIEENYGMKLKQKEYELLMLQSQITPIICTIPWTRFTGMRWIAETARWERWSGTCPCCCASDLAGAGP